MRFKLKSVITEAILIGLILILTACNSDDDAGENEPQMGYFPSEMNYITNAGETGTYYFSYNERNQITSVSLDTETVGYEVDFEYQNSLITKFSVDRFGYVLNYTSTGRVTSLEAGGDLTPVVYSESDNTYSVYTYSFEFDQSNVLTSYNIGYNIQVETNPDRDGPFKNLEFQPGLLLTALAVDYMADMYFYSPVEVNGYDNSNTQVLFTNTYNKEGMPEVVTQKNASGNLITQITWTYEKRNL